MVNLHVHDCRGSLLDAILEIDEIVNFAKENKQKAIAITNHGTMHSYVDFYKSAIKNNIKPIIGCEVYEVDNMLLKNDTKENKQPRYHLILLAKNEKGYHNLIKIVSEGYLKGFYTKPRIDLDFIEKNNLGKGIICLTACMAGRLSRILEGRKNIYTADGYVNRLNKIFDYVSLEIQSHPREDQAKLNDLIIETAKRNNMKYVITTDAHMLRKDQLDTHAVFVKIGSEREVGELYDGCYLQNDKEVHKNMDVFHGKEVINKAIKETEDIADMIEIYDIGLNNDNLMPKIPCPKEYKSNLEYLENIIHSLWEKQFGHLSKEEQQLRVERIFKEELPVLKELDYIDYFLMLVMLTKEAKKRGIPLGYSRGSGANCETLYAIGVTQIDSIRWDLDFSRFANLGRKSPADYDMDISKRRRGEMVEVAEYLFGEENVAPICTFNNLSTKVAIKDIGKVLNEREGEYKGKIPYNLRDKVAKAIPTIKTINDLGEEEEKDTLLKDILFTSEELKKIYEEFPLWFKYVMELEGKPKSLGRHACFTGDTLILTDRGYKQIKEIKIGDKVLTHNNRYKEVVDVMDRYDNIYTVKPASSFPIKTTSNHPFLVRKRLSYKKEKKYDTPKWVQVKDINKMDLVGIPINNKSIIPNFKKLPTNNKDFWWIIGRYMSNGWYEDVNNKNEKMTIICCEKKDDLQLKEIECKLNKIGFTYRYETSRSIYKIFIKNKELFEYLKTFGKNSYGKHLNNDILNLPKELLKSFLEGFLSTDGSFDKKINRYSFEIASKKLALEILHCIFKVYNRHCSFTADVEKDIIEGRITDKKEKYKIEFSKHDRLKDQSFCENGYLWTPIKDIKKTDIEEKVYNLSVLDDNSYTVNNVCVHNCGTIISPFKLMDYVPLCLDSDGNQMLQLEMHNAMDDLGLVKMDFLGLKNLDIADDCIKLIHKTWDDFNINTINLDDKEVLKDIYANGHTVGIFQMESAEATNMCKQANVDTVDDVIAINAFNRPGTKDGFPIYCKNKSHPEQVKVLHEDLRKIFATTHCVLLFQEQALQLFRHAKFPEDQVDNARRAIGKKKKEVMLSLKVDFEKGLKSIGWNQYQIDEIWNLMVKQSEYCFNKGHSVAYGLLSYLTAYLKHYYPLEFMTASLNAEMGNTGKIGILIEECKRNKIVVAPPNVNHSDEFYTPYKKDNKILYGLYPIKGMGSNASKFIIKNRPYKGFKDFLNKVSVDDSPVNKKDIICLIKSGAIPTKNKNKTLIEYAKTLIKVSEYKEVKSLPTLLKLETEWGIDTNIFKDKQSRLKEYNKKKKEKFYKEQENKTNKKLKEFKEKYIGDETFYEFDTLSMFLTNNPFEKLNKSFPKFHEVNESSECVVLCSIIEIKRKKDKKGKAFCYLDLFTTDGIIEAICWASSYSKYQDLIKKGNHIAILGRKKEEKLIVEKIKSLKQWMIDTGISL